MKLTLTSLCLFALTSPLHAAPDRIDIPTHRQTAIGLRALSDVEGADHVGKDGPMRKIGYDLALVYHEHADYVAKGGLAKLKTAFTPSNRQLRVANDLIVIDVTSTGDTTKTLHALEQLGMVDSAVFGRMISGRFPVAALDKLAALTDIQVAAPALAAVHTGSVTSQGDVAMYSNSVRAAYALDGNGIAIGTLSDSYNCKAGAAGNVTSNDLPANITVLADETGCASGTDEGRAMMQIIHDIAPGSRQMFHTGFAGMASMANGIVALANAGAHIITDDVIYYAEPMFQDGIIAQAADQVHANGVAYFSAAGNFYNRSYEAPFRDSGTRGYTPRSIRHDFDAGTSVDGLMQVTIPANTTVVFILQWDDPFYSVSGSPGADTDLDIILYSSSGTALTGATNNNLGNDPVEIFSYSNTSAASVTYQLAIDLIKGPHPGKLKLVYNGNMTVNEYATNSPTLYGHANAAGAMAVGAVRYSQTPAYGVTPPVIESYSSLGGVPILFSTTGTPVNELRQKPDVAAPDGVDNTFFGSDSDGNGRPNFFGTSAAAPHAAGLAALILDYLPSTSAATLYASMRTGTVDMLTANFDYKTGRGLVQSELILAVYDLDRDTIANSTDNCPDTSNQDQINHDTDTLGDVCDVDDDNDGLLDTDEQIAGTDQYDFDTDNDGIWDGDEVLVHNTSPSNPDTDNDGLSDGEEITTYHMDPLSNDKGRLAPRGSPDNELNVADFLIQQRIILGFITATPVENKLADMNNDGELNVADMLLLERKFLSQ